jgi:hypothetical protein
VTKHQREVHSDYVEDCFGCRIGSVSVAASAMPSRAGGAAAKEINDREARWHKDLPAYKRLREDGTQPKGIDGAARLERDASSKVEIEMGRTFGPKAQAKVEEGMQLSKAMGYVK